jgi:hypothetical protein
VIGLVDLGSDRARAFGERVEVTLGQIEARAAEETRTDDVGRDEQHQADHDSSD